MSESSSKSARAAYHERQEGIQAQQQQAELKRRIDYINHSYDQMKALRTKEAWKSFMFLRKEIKASIRGWQKQINKVSTPEDERKYYIGCVFGASAFFQIVSNLVRMKKDISKNKFADILNHFKGGEK